jgi:uncharacterized protein YecA (UPF0149 family)
MNFGLQINEKFETIILMLMEDEDAAILEDLHRSLPFKAGEEPIFLPKWQIAPKSKSLIVPPKVGRNEPCPCGSGRKFKRCCNV